MALKFYLGGTTGERNGTEVSSGTFSNPIIADGFYPGVGSVLDKAITIHIRADAGETWTHVFVALVRTSFVAHNSCCFGSQPSGGGLITECTAWWFKQEVGDVNIPIVLWFRGFGDDTNMPDLNIKLAIMGGVQIV